jgi:riboflavin transporter FmnP
MKKSIGSTDNIILVVAAIVIAVWYFTKKINGNIAIVLGIVATILLLTCFINFFPLYAILGTNTYKRK